MISIPAIVLLAIFGWTIWIARPIVRTGTALLLVMLTAYVATNIATTRERNRIHVTYFRGLSMTFWDLNQLAKTNKFEELAVKLEILNRDFPMATGSETQFNAMINRLMTPDQTETNN